MILKYYLKLILLLVTTTIIFQGSQCASREMTTAKLAIRNQDVPKAIENLLAEIRKNPNNGEAYILLAELRVMQGDLPAALALMEQAEPLVANNPTLRDKPAHFKFEIFQQSVKSAEEAFNNFAQTRDKSQLQVAIQNYQVAVLLRPAFFEGYRMLGWCNELADRPDAAIAAYLEYIKILQPSIDIAVQNGFYIGTETKSLAARIGSPTVLREGRLTTGEPTVLEKYTVRGNDLFVFSVVKAGETVAKVESWSYNPPKNILPGEREIVPSAMTQPINSLAVIYYNRREKDNSLRYFQMIASIEPFDANVNSAIVTLFQELGRPEEAERAINENVTRNPDNYIFIAQLGDLFMNRGEYDNAIEQYERALAINPNFEAALRNIGACFGNKAARIQQEQNDLVAARTIRAVDVNTFAPYLIRAAEYFTRVLQTPTFRNNPDVMGDLVNIYMALPDKKALFEQTLRDFENLESTLSQAQLEQYYFRLLRIYGQTSNPKYATIEAKLNQLIGQ